MKAEPRSELPGLPAERTALSWERTALGLAGTAALLLAREGGSTDRGPLVAAGAALLLAVATAWAGQRRARRIRQLRGGTTAAPVAEIRLIGFGVIALGLLIAATAAF